MNTAASDRTAIVNECRQVAGLLVDDHKAQLNACSGLFKDYGVVVDTASTVQAAMDLVDSSIYSFAVIDLVMDDPNWTTEDLVIHLRKRQPNCRVFVLTGYPNDAVGLRWISGIPILRKPLSEHDFLRIARLNTGLQVSLP